MFVMFVELLVGEQPRREADEVPDGAQLVESLEPRARVHPVQLLDRRCEGFPDVFYHFDGLER